MDSANGMTLAERQKNPALDPFENRILLCHALSLTRIELMTRSERRISPEEAARLDALIRRRLDGEPIAYIVGQREFYGLDFSVTPDVLIPRPETELLVELALQRLAPNASVLDMGTGSGALAVSIAHSRPDVRVLALDISEAALAVARLNAVRHDAHVDFLRSDWYQALNGTCFSMIVANPPYIEAGDQHLQQGDLRFEPIDALTDHADGLASLRAIAADASAHLESDGWLLMEHGYDQAARVRQLLVEKKFAEVQSWRDLAGIERVSGGKLPASR